MWNWYYVHCGRHSFPVSWQLQLATVRAQSCLPCVFFYVYAQYFTFWLIKYLLQGTCTFWLEKGPALSYFSGSNFQRHIAFAVYRQACSGQTWNPQILWILFFLLQDSHEYIVIYIPQIDFKFKAYIRIYNCDKKHCTIMTMWWFAQNYCKEWKDYLKLSGYLGICCPLFLDWEIYCYGLWTKPFPVCCGFEPTAPLPLSAYAVQLFRRLYVHVCVCYFQPTGRPSLFISYFQTKVCACVTVCK